MAAAAAPVIERIEAHGRHVEADLWPKCKEVLEYLIQNEMNMDDCKARIVATNFPQDVKDILMMYAAVRLTQDTVAALKIQLNGYGEREYVATNNFGVLELITVAEYFQPYLDVKTKTGTLSDDMWKAFPAIFLMFQGEVQSSLVRRWWKVMRDSDEVRGESPW